MDFSLTLDNCAIARGGRTILSGVSLSLGRGDLIWLTGDNGIGKSSILRLVAGVLRPESGDVHYAQNGDPVHPSNIIALLAHDAGLHPTLKVCEELDFWADDIAKHTADLEALGLQKLMPQSIKTLSAGQKRRAAIARLILSEKPIWLLDEPLSALDAQGRDILLSCVKTHTTNGGAAIIATHHAPDDLGANASILKLSVPS